MSDIEVKVTVTRSGRASKPPVRYEPQEICEDDYNDDDYESDESDVESILSSDDESESEDEDEDEDENGNLKGFVVDESESEESECD